MIGGAILAAGAATRFGAAKQLAELEGRPLLEHAVAAMTGVPEIERVVVVLGARAEEISGPVAFGRAEPVVCADWQDGQSASLRCALDALGPDLEALVVTLGDQPRITAEAIGLVLAGGLMAEEPAARAAYGGVPGHPVVLRGALLARAAQVRGDRGARDLLVEGPVALVEVGAVARGDDVDTPGELDALR